MKLIVIALLFNFIISCWAKVDIISDYNIFFNMLQNHSSVKLFTLCIHESLMNIYTKFYPRTVSQS